MQQWHIALISVGAFCCIAIGYWLRWLEQKDCRRDETENQVGDVL